MAEELEHYRQTYTPSEEFAVAASLKGADPFNDESIFVQTLLGIYKAFGKLNLQRIEELLRANHCRTYLIAQSVDELCGQYEAKMPDSQRSFPYYLLCITSEEQDVADEAREAIIRGSIQGNFDKLSETGFFLDVKPGSKMAQQSKAPWN